MRAINNYFYFGDHASTEFSLYISGTGTFNAPARDYKSVEIDGRNGNLIIDNGRFKNSKVTYPVFMVGNRETFKRNTDTIREWLHSSNGYQILYDSYHPDEYRMGLYTGDVTFDVKALSTAGEAKLVFEVMPQRFLFEGDNAIEVTNGHTVTLKNPTIFDAKPIIKIYGTGSGTLTIGNKIITITGNTQSSFYIDCDLQEAYADGAVNMNPYISFIDAFPHLPKGSTGVSLNGFTKAEIKPKWWRI